MADYATSQKKAVLSGILSNGGKFDLEGFVAEMQGFNLYLRHQHWETTSFARHKACELIQGDLEDSLDKFVEAAVGMMGGKRPAFKEDIQEVRETNQMIQCLKGLDTKDTALLNIRDEMLGTLYKYNYLETLT